MTSSVPSSPSQLLIEALVQFHKTVPAISKTANAQYGKFADLETVLSTVTPHLIKNGLVISQTFEPSEGVDPILVTRLLHVSGAELVSRLPMIVGKGRNVLHDFGSSCTYLKRYALLALLGLTADMDMDGDFADSKPTTKLQIQQTPKKGPAVEGVAKDDQPLTTEERNMLVGLISEMSPGKREDFCKSFRFAFKLGDNAKVAPAITSRKHQVWIQENA
jgi:hypothetical protein